MAKQASKPTIVFVPGMSSVGTVVYAPLVSALEAQGYPSTSLIPVNNLSVDSKSNVAALKPNALAADIRNLRTTLTRLINDEGRDVIIVAHSYGATPALSAAAGLWKHQRLAGPKAGGITRVALIASSLTLPGGSVASERSAWQKANNLPTEDGAGFEMVDGEPFLTPTGFENFWMNDITDAAMRASLRPAAMSSAFTLVADDIDPKEWRISYLILTELDLAMPEALQRHLIERAKSAGAEVDDATTLKAGHFAQVSKAEEVATWVLGLL